MEAEKYGRIVDIPFPNVNADATEKDVQELSKSTFKTVMSYHPKAVLCQGEFTLAFQLINMLLENEIVVLAACSERIVKEDGARKESYFTFTKFRNYTK